MFTSGWGATRTPLPGDTPVGDCGRGQPHRCVDDSGECEALEPVLEGGPVMSSQVMLESIREAGIWGEGRGRKGWRGPGSDLREVGEVGAFEVGDRERGGSTSSGWEKSKEVAESDVSREEEGLVGAPEGNFEMV